ncbi:MAG: hypothetical protein ACRC7N_18290 [Clostridium sp.]
MSTNEKNRNTCSCNSNDLYKQGYYSSNFENNCCERHEHEHDHDDELDCCFPQQKPHHKEAPARRGEPCNCCKHALQHAMKLLFCSPFNSYIDPAKFTLVTALFTTAADATQIKNISSCNGDGITYNDGTTQTYTTFCDLTGFTATLLTPATNVPLFLQAIKAIIPCYDSERQCCNNDSCCCNSSKASYLSGTLSTVDVSADGFNGNAVITKLTVAAITDDLAILVDAATGKVYFICLNALRLIG